MKIQAIRLPENPIITPASSPSIGTNINGPSLIRVPNWVPKPLGRYYLYFADHGGKFIRLAVADRVEGPWKVYEPGTLHLEQVPWLRGHIASPDVHVDDAARQIRMYFHGPAQENGKGIGQKSFVALSQDGLTFQPCPEVLGDSYFRVWQWGGWYYALATRGALYRSRDGLSHFEAGPVLFGGPGAPKPMRHCAVKVHGHTLFIFFSLIGDCPERIRLSTLDLRPDWRQWKESEPIDVLAPEKEYEGADLPLEPSRSGAARTRVRQLRDPAIYEEAGTVYLLYSIAGESGLAMAKLRIGTP